jgi:hypothetical protein
MLGHYLQGMKHPIMHQGIDRTKFGNGKGKANATDYNHLRKHKSSKT